MSPSSSSLWTKTVAFGVIGVACVVGNVSLSASDAKPGAARPAPHSFVGTGGVVATASRIESPQAALLSAGPRLAEEARSGFGYSKFDSPVMDAEREALPAPPSDLPEVAPASEFGQVVPAIYAWDPDVRFVFYRHVSKWM